MKKDKRIKVDAMFWFWVGSSSSTELFGSGVAGIRGILGDDWEVEEALELNLFIRVMDADFSFYSF